MTVDSLFFLGYQFMGGFGGSQVNKGFIHLNFQQKKLSFLYACVQKFLTMK